MAMAEIFRQLALEPPRKTNSVGGIDSELLAVGCEKETLDLVFGRRLWKERQKGPSLFIFLEEPERICLLYPSESENNIHLKLQKDVFKHRFSGVVVVSTKELNNERVDAFKKVFQSIKRLKEKSPVFLSEIKYPGFERQPRESLFKEINLKKIHVYTGLSKSLNLTEGRKEAKKKPLNLISGKNPKTLNYLRRLWREMSADYRKYGIKIIDAENSDIVKRLKKSKYPKEDIGKLMNGFGVSLLLSCGGECKVELNGQWQIYKKCIDEDCDGCNSIKNFREQKLITERNESFGDSDVIRS